MAIIDLVKWDGSPHILAWKFPSEELSTWTQLIVNESQEAFVVRGGVYDGPFGAGRHTLTTENIPGIRALIGLPFGGRSPFSAEVWFVNRTTKLDVKWGTPDPIQLEDPRYRIMVPVRAFGQYGLRVTDSKRFLLKLVGTVSDFSIDTLAEYFRGALMTSIKTQVATAIVRRGQSVLEISTELEALSLALKSSVSAEIASYGAALAQFNIHSINVPEDDPTVQSLKAALAKRAEMGIVGYTYQQERSFDVMQSAASNEGSAGTLMGAGLGLGAGVAIVPPIAQAFSQLATAASLHSSGATSATANAPQDSPSTSTRIDSSERIRLLKELAALKDQGAITQSEFDEEKKRILSGS